MSVDFGYVVNSGVTEKQKIYNETYHDDIVLNLELRMSDDLKTANDETHELLIATKFGDIISVCEYINTYVYVPNNSCAQSSFLFFFLFTASLPVTSHRMLRKEEEGDIVITSLNATDSSTPAFKVGYAQWFRRQY